VQGASFILLRLPLTVEPVFLEWLQRTQPQHQERVLCRIRQCREGRLSDSKFGSRMRGSGEIAEQIKHMFQLFSRKYGLDQPLPELNCELFVPPKPDSGQLRLF
jgi:DNA repair photolyase